MGVFKLALLAIGMIGGAYFAGIVTSWLWAFVVIAALSSGYIIAASFSGANKR